MSINIANLELAISKLLANAQSPVDSLILSKAISFLNTGSISVYSDLASLPVASSTAVSAVVYVLSDKIVYISDGSIWRPISSPATGWVVGWGRGYEGQIGSAAAITTNASPIFINSTCGGWKQVSAGWKFSAAISKDNTLWAWGKNYYGELGDNTTINKSSPVSVVGGFTDWVNVSVSKNTAVALRNNGTLWAWGCNTSGQLGDGATINKSSPVSVVGGFTDWCQASAGSCHTAAIRTNGSLWAWGCNVFGRLGDNTIIPKSSPVSVVGGFTDWCQVSAGAYNTAAVRTNGTIWAWGFNGSGALGDGTAVSRSSPVSVVGGFTDWCQVSAGACHTAAVRSNGTLWAWGFNTCGRLGDGTVISKTSPVSVVGGFTDWCAVSAGTCHTLAVRTNGTAWAWGRNINSVLGDGTSANRSSPVSVVSGFTDWCQVSAGLDHSMGIIGSR